MGKKRNLKSGPDGVQPAVIAAASASRHFISEWALTIVLLLFGTTTLLQAFVIPSGSMENTLLPGDHVIADKLAYSPPGSFSKHLLPYSDVRRGDIIVLRYPPDLSLNYVKRAIGVPGDRIRFVNKRLVLNGKEVHEPYAIHKDARIVPYRDNFPNSPPADLRPEARFMLEHFARNGELSVPPGYYLALGDNRDDSDDSRYWGLVPRENIIGKPLLVWWSSDAPREQLEGFPLAPDHLTDLAQHFFTKTRWPRSMRLIRAYPLR